MKIREKFERLKRFLMKLFRIKEKPSRVIGLVDLIAKGLRTEYYFYTIEKLEVYSSGIKFQFTYSRLYDKEVKREYFEDKTIFLPNGETSLMFEGDELFWDYEDEVLRYRPVPAGSSFELRGLCRVYENGAFIVPFEYADRLSKEALDYSFGKNDEGYMFCWYDHSIAPVVFEWPAFFMPLLQFEIDKPEIDNFFNPLLEGVWNMVTAFTPGYFEKKGFTPKEIMQSYNQNLKNSQNVVDKEWVEDYTIEDITIDRIC